MKSIFILGTGRSGTHHLCRSLLDFSNIEDYMNGYENHDILGPLTEFAIKHQPLNNKIINYYRSQISKASQEGKIFLDQCHANIHHYDQLNLEFKDSVFIGIDRPTEQIVASMFNHKGTSRRYKYIHKGYFNNLPFPNNFFGVQNLAELKALPKHILFAKRVIAHKKINKKLLSHNNFKLLNFEEFINNKQKELNRIFSENTISGFGDYSEKEFSKKDVLTKYRQVLSKTEIKEIRKLEKNY